MIESGIHPSDADLQTGLPPVETIERPEGSFDDELNAQYEDLLQHGHPVNSGTYGLIYRMNFIDASPDLRTGLQQMGVDVERGPAVKVLKIYINGKGREEYLAQRKAYDIVAQSDQKDLALVPRPLEERVVKIKSETQRVLHQEGASIAGGQVEAIMMDYIDGPDLATVFYRWIVDHAPDDKEYVKQSTHPDNFEQLQTAVSEILEFKKPGGKSPNEAEREGEKHRVNKLNSNRVYAFLKKTGFRLNPKIVTHIRNTLELFESQGFYHNDDHERNFMVVGDYLGDGDVTTYIIDFDKAGPADPDVLSFRVDKQLEELIAATNADQGDITELRQDLTRFSGNPNVIRYTELLEKAADKIEAVALNRGLACVSTEAMFNEFVSSLLVLVEKQKMSPEQARSVLASLKQNMVTEVKVGRKLTKKISNPAIYNSIDSYSALFSS